MFQVEQEKEQKCKSDALHDSIPHVEAFWVMGSGPPVALFRYLDQTAKSSVWEYEDFSDTEELQYWIYILVGCNK